MLPATKSWNYVIGLISFSLLFVNSSFAQLESEIFGLSKSITSEDEVKQQLATNWDEDVSLRTVLSSTFFSEDGQIKIIQSSVPINYYNSSNQIVPIESELKLMSDDRWAALQQPFPTYLNSNGSFELTLSDNKFINFGKSGSINGLEVEFVSIDMVDGVSAVMLSNIPGIKKELMFRENGVKYNYVLYEPLEILAQHVFSDEVIVPNGYSIRTASSDVKSNVGLPQSLEILDESGRVVSKIHPPLCIDNANNSIVASYKIRNTEIGQYLEIHVPGSWLNDPSRAYPIVIDPLVTGPTAAWAGGTMPSCFDPAVNQDSILITIPAAISVTQLNVSASYYADPLTGAVMGQGAMSFSTDCGSSQIFTITGAPATTSGTAYLDNFDLYNPLTCCFPESCSSQSFYLSMNLSRNALGSGCNATYVRYDPVTTSWPFQAIIIGRTVEAYSGQWSVPSAPICSNQCTINGTAYAYFGVPPYTITHPWSTDTMVVGQNIGCSSGATNAQFILTIPDCPSFCDGSFTSLDVPPANILDACGNGIDGLPTRTVPIKTAPDITAVYDTLVCSGVPFFVDLESCLPLADIVWTGNGNVGSMDFYDTLVNNNNAVTSTSYITSASYDGCISDVLEIVVNVKPLPIVNYSYAPDPIVAGLGVNFTDQSDFSPGFGVFWGWDFGDSTILDIDQNPTHTYPLPGEYYVCLEVVDDSGCQDTLCKILTVVPVEITAPNIVTPNNDEVNDLLEFEFLEFYPDNDISIFNRWGELLFHQSNYSNDWDGTPYSEGTYFYILNIYETESQYQNFFQIVK
jgi:gliding motility-associated-like protein